MAAGNEVVIGHATIKTALDADGIDTGVDAGKRALRELAEEAKRTGREGREGFRPFTEGAPDAAAKMERATANIRSQLERTIAQFSAGERGSRQFFESLINQRGGNLAQLQPLLDQLDRYKQKAAQAADAARLQADAQEAAARRAAEAAREQARAQAEAAREAQQALQAQQQFMSGLQNRVDTFGKSAADIAEMRAQQLGLTAQAGPLIARMREQEAALRNVGATSRTTAREMAMIAPQMTDIVTSIAGGQNPMLVMLQQGGQLRDMFGSTGAAARAMGGFLRGLINPLTLAAGAIAAIGIAAYKGSQEQGTLQRMLIETGNAAGRTADDLVEMSRRMAEGGTTQSRAVAALAEMGRSSEVAREHLEMLTSAALKWERATGTAIAETLRHYEELGRSPVEASAKLNKQYNYLTKSVLDQIVALDEQGKKTEAARLAQETFANMIATRAPQIEENLGYIQRGWAAVGRGISTAINALMDWGRAQTQAERLAEQRAKLAKLQAEALLAGPTPDRRDINSRAGAGRTLAAEARDQEIQALQEQIRMGERAMEQQNAASRQTRENAATIQRAADEAAAEAKRREEERKRRGEQAARERTAAEIEQLEQLHRIVEQRTRTHVQQLQDQRKAGAISEVQLIEGVAAAELEALESSRRTAAAQLQAARTGQSTQQDRIRLAGELSLIEQVITDRRAQSARDVQAYFDRLRGAAVQFGIDQRAEWEQEQREAERETQDRSNAARALVREYEAEVALVTEEMRFQQELSGMSIADQRTAIELRRIELRLRQQLAELDTLAGYGRIDRVEFERRRAEMIAAAGRQAAAVQANAAVEAWGDASRRIGDTFYDILLTRGEDAAGKLKRLFSQLVLEPMLRLGVNAGMSALGLGTGPAGTGGAGGMLSGLGQLGSLGSLGGTLGNVGSFTGLLSGAAATGVPVAPGIGMAAGGLGSLGGIGGALAAVPGWGWAAAAVVAMLASGAFKGETRGGGHYALGQTNAGTYGPTAQFLHGPSGGQIIPGAEALQQTANGINSLLQRMGSGQRLTGLYAGMEASERDRGGVYGGGFIGGRQFGDLGLGGGRSNYRGTLYEAGTPFSGTPEEMAQAFARETKQLTIQALQAAAAGATADIPQFIRERLASVDAEAMTDEAATAFLASIEGVVAGVDQARTAFEQLPIGQLRALSFDATQAMIEAAGGVQNLIQGAQTYQERFYSDAERQDHVWRTLVSRFGQLGLVLPSTTAAYRQLVEQQDLTTAAGQRNYAALLSLSGAFAELYPAVQEVGDAVDETAQRMLDAARDARSALNTTRDELTQAYQRERGEIEATTERLVNFVEGMADFRRSLLMGELSPLTPEQRYAEALAAYTTNRAAAAAGGVTGERAQAEYAEIARAFLEASQEVNASSTDYQRDFARVLADTQAAQEQGQLQLDVQRESLNRLDLMVAGLIRTTEATLSVREAIDRLAAISDAVTHTPAGGTMDFVTRAFLELLGRAPDAEGASYFRGMMAVGATEAEIRASIMNSPEYRRLHGVPLASGLDRVPFDGFPATLHRDEAVLNRRDAQAWRSGAAGGSSAVLERISDQLAQLRADTNEAVRVQVHAVLTAADRAAQASMGAARETASVIAYANRNGATLK